MAEVRDDGFDDAGLVVIATTTFDLVARLGRFGALVSMPLRLRLEADREETLSHG